MIKSLIDKHECGNNTRNLFTIYKNNFKLQAEVELLEMSMLYAIEKADNSFLENDYPLLVGKRLRNYLAHGNVLIDILTNPNYFIILNAKARSSISAPTHLELLQSSFLNAKAIKEDINELTIQMNFFSALSQQTLECVKSWLKKGADIFGRTHDSMSSLHFAAKSPDVENLQFLLKRGLSINLKDKNNQTILHIAAASGRKNIVKYLILKHNFNIEEKESNCKTPLHLAAQHGCAEVVEVLLRCKAKTDCLDLWFLTPLHHAIFNDHLDIVKLLVPKYENVNEQQLKGGYSLLHLAAYKGHLNIVKYLIREGAEINTATDLGFSPLHDSAKNGYIDTLEYLILKGAKVNIKSKNGDTPLLLAIKEDHENIIKFLLEKNADVNAASFDGLSPLLLSVSERKLNIVKLLLKNNANIRQTTKEGMSVLHFASMNNDLGMAKLLIRTEDQINVKNEKGQTPLHISIINGNISLTQILIENGADINLSNLNPFELLNSLENIEYLIDNGLDVILCSKNGSSLLHAIVSILSDEYFEWDEELNFNIKFPRMQKLIETSTITNQKVISIIDHLVYKGLDLNLKNYFHQTPLHLACFSGKYPIISHMIHKGADMYTFDKRNLIPFHYLILGNQLETLELLISSKMCDINANGFSSIALEMAVDREQSETVNFLVHNVAGIDLESLLMKACTKGSEKMVDIILKKICESKLQPFTDNFRILQNTVFNGHDQVVATLLGSKCLSDDICSLRNKNESLITACRHGHSDVVNLLLNHGADVNACDKQHLTPLIAAIDEGYTDIVIVLLDKGAKTDVLDCNKRLPIEIAVEEKHLEILKLLFPKQTLETTSNRNDGFSLLHIAAKHGYLDIVKYLVNENDSMIHGKNSRNSKPIHIAAEGGHIDIVKYLLNYQSVNERGCENMTLLHYGAQGGCLDLCEFLIQEGLDVNAPNDTGFRPIHMASRGGFADVVKLLMKHGAYFNCCNEFNKTPLQLATEQHVTRILNMTGNLFSAIMEDKIDEVKYCIANDAFVNAKDKSNFSPLHHASKKSSGEIISVLLENKADPNAVGKNFWTPFHCASKSGNFKIVRKLLEYGAIYNASSISKETALNLSEDKDVIVLLNFINTCFQDIENGETKVIDNLKKQLNSDSLKAIMNARNTTNKTLIEAAIFCGFPEIIKLKKVFTDVCPFNKNIFDLLIAFEEYDLALNIKEKISQNLTEMLGPENLLTLEVKETIATLCYKQQNFKKALEISNEIHNKRCETLGLSNESTLKIQEVIGLILHKQHKNEEALKILNDVCDKQKQSFGEQDLLTLTHLALVYNCLGKHEDALETNTMILKRMRQTMVEWDPKVLVVESNIAGALLGLERFPEAEEKFKKLYELRKHLFGSTHSDTLKTMYALQLTLIPQNKMDEALKGLNEVLDSQIKYLGFKNIDTLNTHFLTGHVLFLQNKYVSALEIFKENLHRSKLTLEATHPLILLNEMIIDLINS